MGDGLSFPGKRRGAFTTLLWESSGRFPLEIFKFDPGLGDPFASCHRFTGMSSIDCNYRLP
jgi:hypothetical protein